MNPAFATLVALCAVLQAPAVDKSTELTDAPAPAAPSPSLASPPASTTAAATPANATPAARERMVVLPVRMPEGASADQQRAAVAMERVLTGALRRHAEQEVVSRQEVAARLGEAMQKQLMGCDAESCVAELANALGAEFAVATTLSVRDGTWTLQGVMIRRKDVKVMQRGTVRASSLQGVLSSMDPLARQLVGGNEVVLADPRLAERLGTSTEAAQELREAARKDGGKDVASAWTALILRHNRESAVIPVLQGVLLLGGAAGLVVLSVLQGVGVGRIFAATAIDFQSVPVLPISLAVGSLAAAAVITLGTVGAVVGLGVVDALDVGRVPVSADGCCRDDDALETAASPGVAARMALVAGASAAAALVALPFLAGAMALLGMFSLAVPPLQAVDGAVRVPTGETAAMSVFIAGIMLPGLLFPLGLVLAGTSVATVITWLLRDRTPLTDGD